MQAQNELSSALTKQSELTRKASDIFAGTKVSIPTNFGGTGVSGSSGGGSGKSDAEKEADKAEKLSDDIAKMEAKFTPDPYFELNNAIKGVDNELEVNKELLDSLTEGSPEYQQAQLQQIEIEKKKQVALQNLNDEQKKQSQTLKDYLTQYGFTTDEIGNLNNSQSQIQYWKDITDAMTGSTEEEKAKKQEWIDWIKELEDKTKDYTDLVNDKIPSVANQWSEVANQIKKTTEEMKKANEETLDNMYQKVAGDILEDMKKEATKAEEEADKAEERAKKALESEKEAKAKYWEDRIKALQDELDKLNDETADNQEKLRKLKAERSLWAKETGNVFAKSKIDELDKSIAETEKTLKKDALSKQIEDLNKQKEADLSSYDDKIKDQEEYYAKKKEKEKKANDDSLLEEKAYAKAKKLITENNQTELLKILTDKSQSYKDVGSLLGKNFSEAFQEELNKVKQALDSLNGINGGNISSASGGSTSSNGRNSEVKIGDSVKVSNSNGDVLDVQNGSAVSSSGSLSQYSGDTLKTIGYDNGYFKVSNEDGTVGWVRRDDIARFKTGGRISSSVSSDGGLAIVEPKEKILNVKDTNMLDEIADYIKSSGAIVGQLSSQYSNLGNYTIPSLGANLNDLTNGVTNNNTNNSNTQSISMPVTIINEKGAEQFTPQKLEKEVIKIFQKQSTRFGGRPI